MPRVTRGTQHTKRRRNLLAYTKGYKWGRKSKIKLARTAMLKAGAYAFRDRRAKKRTFRRLWNIKINAAARELGTTYSRLIAALVIKEVRLNRKSLAHLAEHKPAVFKNVVDAVK
ncbi:50S ribosomal protein L20 [Candidatus Uhrbacteria bacterium RIFCSPLOWO2_01_FULL_53_9]|uniref:Large ribosomal subunit protein bL20 n=1 Tax=Candidatus Uhrbacteria bacterium RIFCSPLOWO2_01_FULL_53_9 TaxID=1802403 RepID=A0A1F7UZM3_9BACT|nr:MAG: 50S ribosomal protein L20 [Candidatus Uhrbacteria bacterium RIFCSPLOWO2_01_FULL_53_9]